MCWIAPWPPRPCAIGGSGEGDEQRDEDAEDERDGVGGGRGGRGADVVALAAAERDPRCGCHLEEGRRPADEVEDRGRERKTAELGAAEMTDDRGVGDRVERLDDERGEGGERRAR